MYHVSAQGVDERVVNVRYYYCYAWNLNAAHVHWPNEGGEVVLTHICPEIFFTTEYPDAKSLPFVATGGIQNTHKKKKKKKKAGAYTQPPLLWIKEALLQRSMSAGCQISTQLTKPCIVTRPEDGTVGINGITLRGVNVGERRIFMRAGEQSWWWWWWWCRASCPRMSVDILGTNCDQCRSMVQCCFTSTETVRLIRTESSGRPPRLSHSSWTLRVGVVVDRFYSLQNVGAWPWTRSSINASETHLMFTTSESCGRCSDE